MPTFSYAPSFPPRVSHAPRILAMKFGDGYEQRAGDGINTDPERWDLIFENEPPADADAIESFLKTQAGRLPFDWTSPSGLAAKFLCKTWQRAKVGPQVYTITAAFEQTFDP